MVVFYWKVARNSIGGSVVLIEESMPERITIVRTKFTKKIYHQKTVDQPNKA